MTQVSKPGSAPLGCHGPGASNGKLLAHLLRRGLIGALLVIALSVPALVHAQDIRQSSVADVVVRDQHDQALRFYTDLVQGKVVAVNFVFTSCTMVCPIMGAGFAHLQHLLGERTGVELISVSIDPLRDSPARLLQWSQKFGAKAGWTLVTGSKADIDQLLNSLGASAADRDAHAPQVLIIDDRARISDGNSADRQWTRVNGLSDPVIIHDALVSLLDRPTVGTAAATVGTDTTR